MLRMGVSTPVVVQVPGISGAWERQSGIAEVARVAQTADRLGFDHVTCSEHVAVPPQGPSVMLESGRGTVYYDPLATLSYLAAVTSRIRLLTSVVVLGYHHPLELAKRFGTLDRISGGRLVLGVGVGSLAEEFALLKVPFSDRGPRADDALRALRASLSERVPSYRGTHYEFSGMVVEPHAVQEHVPIWVGGNSLRAARRARELADGWLPATMSPKLLRERLERHPAPHDRFDVVVRNAEKIDPAREPQEATDLLSELAIAGATLVQPNFVHESLSHFLEQLEALSELDVFSPAQHIA